MKTYILAFFQMDNSHSAAGRSHSNKLFYSGKKQKKHEKKVINITGTRFFYPW